MDIGQVVKIGIDARETSVFALVLLWWKRGVELCWKAKQEVAADAEWKKSSS